jgi:hypothetical protein
MIRSRQVRGKEDLVFTVTEETLPNGDFRTLSIEGTIRYIAGRQSHSGDVHSQFDYRGHLIGDQFGGPGARASGNMASMHYLPNQWGRGQYAKMEAAVKELLGDQPAFMKVDVSYSAADDPRPHQFDVYVQYANGMHSRWKIFNFNPGLPNPYLPRR